jgi:hypothetical protein
MFKLVRDIFNVSTKFREELGAVFWRGSKVHCTERCYGKEFLEFLEDLPSVHSGIKSLEITFDTALENVHLEDLEAFHKLCKYCTDHLKLAHLNVHLNFRNRELPAKAEGRASVVYWTAFTVLKVNKSFFFGLSGSIKFLEDRFRSDFATKRKAKKKLAKK